MKAKLLFTTFLVSIFFSANSQEQKIKMDESKKLGGATKSQIFSIQCQGTVRAQSADLKWRPILSKKCIGFEPGMPNEELIEKIKSEKEKLIQPETPNNRNQNMEPSTQAVTPVVGVNYLGNVNNGSSPLDNSMAISNGGWIVSVANTTIEYDNMSGNTIYYNDIVTFINDPTVTGVCDPVVIYDAGSDRFIFFCQTCPLNNNSSILIFYSKTNDPNDDWWYYKVTGDPLSNGDAFDYPKLAVSTNELYITGNLFSSPSYNNFDQAILYQIDKLAGYNGGAMNWQYWYNISGSPFTLLPVSYGQGNSYGPGCYLVATDNAGSSTIKVYDLTNDICCSPQLNYYAATTTAYSPTGYNAGQLGTSVELKFFDCRTLSGFYLNGIIHFVFHSDIGSAWWGINYNRLTVSNITNVSSTFGLSGTYDYGYPSVASFATTTTDKSVMIGFGRSSTTIYPEERVVNCDDAMNWSNSTLVKASSSYVSYTGNPERWGDYTGTSRKHNSSTASIWMTGSYGTSAHLWNAWNAEIHSNSSTGLVENIYKKDLKVFPNPIIETCNVEFSLNENTNLNISIVDINGKMVKELFNGKALQGDNLFSFNKANLLAGTYFLMIKNNSNTIKNEKIIVSN